MAKCLVVDDSDVIRRVINHMLEALGQETLSVDSADAALAAYDSFYPDLILLDWHMPGLNVVSFLAQIRGRARGQGVIIIYMTSENDPVDIARALTAGANDYILKPFDRVALAQKLGLSAAA